MPNKYARYATYFFILTIGYAIGFITEGNSKDTLISNIYKKMPLGCQQAMDIELQRDNIKN